MPLYFRIRDRGATVFRLGDAAQSRRLEMTPLAEASIRSGEIRPRGGATLDKAERTEIADWLAARRRTLAARDAATLQRAIEAMNEAATWLSGDPGPAATDAAADDLLLAMHDLRAVILRRKASAARNPEEPSPDPSARE